MKMKFFAIPALHPETIEDELSQFLASHRIIAIDRNFVQDAALSHWAIAVTYLDTAQRDMPDKRPASKHDYRESLADADFADFAQLRQLRKLIAVAEGVPVYALFNNEQLATMARERTNSIDQLASIEGIGPARAARYGEQFLAILRAPTPQPEEASDAAP